MSVSPLTQWVLNQSYPQSRGGLTPDEYKLFQDYQGLPAFNRSLRGGLPATSYQELTNRKNVPNPSRSVMNLIPIDQTLAAQQALQQNDALVSGLRKGKGDGISAYRRYSNINGQPISLLDALRNGWITRDQLEAQAQMGQDLMGARRDASELTMAARRRGDSPADRAVYYANVLAMPQKDLPVDHPLRQEATDFLSGMALNVYNEPFRNFTEDAVVPVTTRSTPEATGKAIRNMIGLDASNRWYQAMRGADANIERLTAQQAKDSAWATNNPGKLRALPTEPQLTGVDIDYLMRDINVEDLTSPYKQKLVKDMAGGYVDHLQISDILPQGQSLRAGAASGEGSGESAIVKDIPMEDTAIVLGEGITPQNNISILTGYDPLERGDYVNQAKDFGVPAYLQKYPGETVDMSNLSPEEVAIRQQQLANEYGSRVSPRYSTRPYLNPKHPVNRELTEARRIRAMYDKAKIPQDNPGYQEVVAREQRALAKMKESIAYYQNSGTLDKTEVRDAAGVLQPNRSGGVGERVVDAPTRVGIQAADGSVIPMNTVNALLYSANPGSEKQGQYLAAINPVELISDVARAQGNVYPLTEPSAHVPLVDDMVGRQLAMKDFQQERRRIRNDYTGIPDTLPGNAKVRLKAINDGIIRVNQAMRSIDESNPQNASIVEDLQRQYAQLRQAEKDITEKAFGAYEAKPINQAMVQQNIDPTSMGANSELSFNDKQYYNQLPMDYRVPSEDLARFTEPDTVGRITPQDVTITNTPIRLPFYVPPGSKDGKVRPPVPVTTSNPQEIMMPPESVMAQEMGYLRDAYNTNVNADNFGYVAKDRKYDIFDYLDEIKQEENRTAAQIGNLTQLLQSNNVVGDGINPEQINQEIAALQQRQSALSANRRAVAEQAQKAGYATELRQGEANLTNAFKGRTAQAMAQLKANQRGDIPAQLPTYEEALQNSQRGAVQELQRAAIFNDNTSPALMRQAIGEDIETKAIQYDRATKAAEDAWETMVSSGKVPELQRYEESIANINAAIDGAIKSNASPERINSLKRQQADIYGLAMKTEDELRQRFISSQRGRILNPVNIEADLNTTSGVTPKYVEGVQNLLRDGGAVIQREALPPKEISTQTPRTNPAAIRVDKPLYGALSRELERQKQQQTIAMSNYAKTSLQKDRSNWDTELESAVTAQAQEYEDARIAAIERLNAQQTANPVQAPKGRLPVTQIAQGDSMTGFGDNRLGGYNILQLEADAQNLRNQYLGRGIDIAENIATTPDFEDRIRADIRNRMADIYANTVTPDMLQPSNGTLGAPPASVDGGLVVALRSPNISGEQFLDELNASRRVYQEPSVVTMVRNSLPDPRKSDLPSPGSSVNADAVPSSAKGWGAIPRSWRTAAMVGVPVAIGGYLLAQQQERARQEEEAYLRNMMMEGMPSPY